MTLDLDTWLRGLGDGPILLHIDMDYFNNRYDGDSDWRQRLDVLDPPLEVVLSKIDELGKILTNSEIRGNIEDVVVSYSPGFFPAEYWSAADAQLRPYLERL